MWNSKIEFDKISKITILVFMISVRRKFDWRKTHLRIFPGVLSARCRFSSSQSSLANLIHGWLRTSSAEILFDAFFTKSLVIKSFASSLTSDHSFSGKLKRPVKIYRCENPELIDNMKKPKIYLHELIQIIALDIFGNSHRDSSHIPLHSCRWTVDSHRARCK